MYSAGGARITRRQFPENRVMKTRSRLLNGRISRKGPVFKKSPVLLAHPTRFERVASAFGGQRSIQLSYGFVGVRLADWLDIGNGLAAPPRRNGRACQARARIVPS